MDPITAALLQKALDGLTERYNFTAQNIANANTANYRPVHVAFEDNLRQAAARGVDAINASAPRVVVDPTTAQGLRVDLELASASQTAMRYRALLEILSQQLAMQRTVLTGGR